MLLFFYILTCTLLILHEIESAFEKEWDILKLPVHISGFLLLHIPVLLIMFYGLYWLDRNLLAGKVVSIILGAGGLIPWVVHKILVHRKDAFQRPVSVIIMAGSGLTGIGLIISTILFF